jgi:hypothetical protein
MAAQATMKNQIKIKIQTQNKKQALLTANHQALILAEQGSLKDAEAAESLMQDTAAKSVCTGV